MNKKVLFAATMAAVLASCSSDDLSLQTVKQQDAAGVENAVSFEAYSQRSLTRAGAVGAMDNDKLKTEGFGVFGYYTDMNEYDQTSTPNFMYNQKVSGAGWTYEPVKYWPNEYGNKAQSDDVDKLSFFAYAPYTANTPATGKVNGDQVGITGFTRNTAAGDPYVKYIASLDPSKCVDLCWGVVDPSANDGVSWDVIQGGSQKMSAGMPWLNVQRPQKSLGQKMKFVFKHALSQLNVQIDADVNTNQHGQGSEVNFNSKVFVRSVTFSGFAMKGALNLNNEEAGTPNWKGYNCNNEPIQSEEYTVYDGMKDGKEGTGYTASNEKVTGLNPSIIQTKGWDAVGTEEGVTKTAKNLFNSTTVNDPIYVIPTGDDMTVTIVYDIETKDANLAGTVSDLETAGVSIENKITKTITLTSADAMKLEAGKKYTINLHLGLSQVEFDATVSDWAVGAEGEAWLPENGAPGPNSISISGADAITAANSYAGTLTATILPAEADQTVTWSSSNPDLLKVDANGNVTLAGGIPLAGEDVTITATSNADGNVKDTKTITVKPALGMFIASDGKAYTTKTADAKAYIAYLSANTDESLAIALENSISGTNWADASSATTPKWMNDAKPAAIDGGTWRWPSKTDFENMLPQLQTLPPNGGGIIRSVRYWSTTEYERNTSTAYDLSFSGSGSDVFIGSKVDCYRDVRAVFAF